MAIFGNMSITNAGQALYVKAQAGKPIIFSKLSIGSGQIGTQNPGTLSALILPQFDIPISSIYPNAAAKSAAISGMINNDNMAEAIYICEIGLWATDPDAGLILYGYASAGTQGDYMAPATQGAYSWMYQVNAAIGNAANVTANISNLLYDYSLLSTDTTLTVIDSGNQKAINKNIDTNLSNILKQVSNIVYISSYPKLAVETNDNGRFSRMLEDLVDGSILILESNAIYNITSMVSFLQNRLTLLGNGTTFNYNNTDATPVLNFGYGAKITVAKQSITATQNSNAIKLNDISNINIGDIFNGYNDIAINNYNDGIYGEVVSIDVTNKTIYLSIASHKTFTITNYFVYQSIEGIVIDNVNINCNVSMVNIGIQVLNAKSSTITRCKSYGNNGRAGIVLRGLNCIIEKCEFQDFYDMAPGNNQSLGYGIAISGHDITVEHNSIKECKHTITAGNRQFYCTGIHVIKNLCYSTRDVAKLINTLQVIDFHANVEGTIDENQLYNIGLNKNGIVVRSNHVIVDKNTLYSAVNRYDASYNIDGIHLDENCTEDVKVTNNRFIGYFNNLFQLATPLAAVYKGFIIRDNFSFYGSITFAAHSGGDVGICDSEISGNRITIEGGIVINNLPNGMIIEKNIIYSSYYEWKLNISITKAASQPCIIKNNKFYHGTLGGDCIRLANDWNIIEDNICRMSDTTTNPINLSANINNISINNIWVRSNSAMEIESDLRKTAYGSGAPTTGTWIRGDYIKNYMPVEMGGSPSKYVINGWTCILGGTPGTWVESRMLTGN